MEYVIFRVEPRTAHPKVDGDGGSPQVWPSQTGHGVTERAGQGADVSQQVKLRTLGVWYTARTPEVCADRTKVGGFGSKTKNHYVPGATRESISILFL